MTFTIDCRQIDLSGVGVYIRGCLPLFLQSENSFVLLGDVEKLKPLSVGRPNARIAACYIKPFSFKELFFFPRRILNIINKTDIFYSPFFNIPGGIKIPVFTTIHDIIFPDMPELTGRAGLAVRMWFFRRAARRSKTIFTVSQFSKSRILHHLGERRVIVTYNTVRDSIMRRDYSNSVKNKSIIFIGNIKKHKGLSILLEAFSKAREEGLDYSLVIVGGRENFRSADVEFLNRVKDNALQAVSWTGHIDDEELNGLIATSALLVQPSLYEGFCIPPLEAMMLGTRALISDIPVLREVYGEAPGGKSYPVTFFKAGDAGELKEKLIELLRDGPPAVRLDEEQKNRYTFAKTAAVILEELCGNLTGGIAEK